MSPVRAAIAIVDHLKGGHHPSYLRLWQAAMERHGFDAHVLSQETVHGVAAHRMHTIHQRHATALAGRHDALGSWSLWRETVRWLTTVERTIGRRFDALALPYADPWVLHNLPSWIVDRTIRRPWTGLLFHSPPVLLERAERFGLGALACRTAAALAVFEELPGLKRWPNTLPCGAPYPLPDVCEPFTEASRERGRTMRQRWPLLAAGRAVVACVGRIARRKNIPALLRAVDTWGGPNRPFVVVAGEPAEADLGEEWSAIRGWFTHADRGQLLEGRLDDESFDACLSNADVVWGCYQNFAGSSNMIAKAAQAGAAVLVNPGGAASGMAARCTHVVVADDRSDVLLAESLRACVYRHSRMSSEDRASLRRRFGPEALNEALLPVAAALRRRMP